VERAHAATDQVTDCTGPTGPGRLTTVVGAAAPGDTITFACSGTITLTSTLILNQSLTIDGSGQAVTLSGGGTVQVVNVAGGVMATLKDLTITNGNSSGSDGGGINNAGTLTISNSTISGNTSRVAGGISNGGTLSISSSTISGNTSHVAGGIVNGGTLTISNSTISGNSSSGGPGGGIDNGGTLTISNGTISGNTGGFGAGIFNVGSLTAGNTIITGNTPGGDCVGGIGTNQGGNLDSDGTCSLGAGHTFAGSGLGALANNGGPTQTMALLAGSPAIGFGISAICDAAPVSGLDQRGDPRPAATCDSGAYEATAPPPPPSRPAPASAPVILVWPAPAALTYGTVLGPVQLDAQPTSSGALVAGTIIYTPPAGTILPVGANQQLIAAFTPLGGTAPTASGLVTITVNPAPTTLSLAATPAEAGAGQPVTLTAQVSSAAGAPVPDGTVTFAENGAALGQATLVNGTASLTAVLPAGALALSAAYTPSLGALGTANFVPSQAATTLSVGQAATTITLASLHAAGTIGQQQRLTAWVHTVGPISPTGTVSFYDTSGGAQTLLGTAPLDADGTTVLTDSGLAVGTHPLLAIYGGDTQNQGSQSATLSQSVRSCSATALLVRSGDMMLDLATQASPATKTAQAVKAHLQVRVGRALADVNDPAVVYCADPGRADAQATISGTLNTGVGPFAKGDPIHLVLKARPATHGALALSAVIVDQQGRRLALAGLFDKGSYIHVTTS